MCRNVDAQCKLDVSNLFKRDVKVKKAHKNYIHVCTRFKTLSLDHKIYLFSVCTNYNVYNV